MINKIETLWGMSAYYRPYTKIHAHRRVFVLNETNETRNDDSNGLHSIFAVAAPDFADARRGGGGFKSGTRSYSTTPKNQQQQITSKKVTALKAPQQDLPLIRNVDSSAAAA